MQIRRTKLSVCAVVLEERKSSRFAAAAAVAVATASREWREIKMAITLKLPLTDLYG